MWQHCRKLSIPGSSPSSSWYQLFKSQQESCALFVHANYFKRWHIWNCPIFKRWRDYSSLFASGEHFRPLFPSFLHKGFISLFLCWTRSGSFLYLWSLKFFCNHVVLSFFKNQCLELQDTSVHSHIVLVHPSLPDKLLLVYDKYGKTWGWLLLIQSEQATNYWVV